MLAMTMGKKSAEENKKSYKSLNNNKTKNLIFRIRLQGQRVAAKGFLHSTIGQKEKGDWTKPVELFVTRGPLHSNGFSV